MLNGCEFREALQAVKVDGGVAGNVVPDRATVTLNHRFAPDRTIEEATDHVRVGRSPARLRPATPFELLDTADRHRPRSITRCWPSWWRRVDAPPMAKLGWTDASFFANRGVPATNFGPGDPNLAHNAASASSAVRSSECLPRCRSLLIG